MDQAPTTYLAGVVEGFYGRAWPHADRLAYARLQSDLGLNAHLHCPKDDPCLRKRWRDDWQPAHWRRLVELSDHYRAEAVAWGVGLSPFALYQSYDLAARKALADKIRRINGLGGTLLGVLFDDMPGDIEDLAKRQAEIVSDIVDWSCASRILVCPTYYSLDPQLERYFGARPAAYWEQLGALLPDEVDIFWTGPEVCSAAISCRHLAEVIEHFGRPLTLWDNYPVNDGAQRSRHLYLDPLVGREDGIERHLRGHFCNPMNQAYCSLPALLGLAQHWGDRVSEVPEEWLSVVLEPETWYQLDENRDEFREAGLAGMGEERCAELAVVYAGLPGPAAGEVAAWLGGEYTFDPACLTD
ncbi:MAG: beta-N-acetylglucosaminidase domain-containing protein [Pseudomonadota bacterium]